MQLSPRDCPIHGLAIKPCKISNSLTLRYRLGWQLRPRLNIMTTVEGPHVPQTSKQTYLDHRQVSVYASHSNLIHPACVIIRFIVLSKAFGTKNESIFSWNTFPETSSSMRTMSQSITSYQLSDQRTDLRLEVWSWDVINISCKCPRR